MGSEHFFEIRGAKKYCLPQKNAPSGYQSEKMTDFQPTNFYPEIGDTSALP